MTEIFLPVLSHFQNGNPWSASMGRLRYRIYPSSAGPDEVGVLTAEVWEGPWAYEFSYVEETKTFPLTQGGLEAVPDWVRHWSETVNTRPIRTLAENISRKITPESPESKASDW